MAKNEPKSKAVQQNNVLHSYNLWMPKIFPFDFELYANQLLDFFILFGALRINKLWYKKENKFGAILTIKVQEVF